MTTPFDIIKHINEKNELDFDYKDYSAFIINRGLSFHPFTVLFANEMNLYSQLEKNMQHDFYFYGIPKGKRFGKWEKADKNDSIIELIKNKYNINNKTAKLYASLMTDDEVTRLIELSEKGGSYGTRSRNSSR